MEEQPNGLVCAEINSGAPYVAPGVLRGSDGWDYESIADRLLDQKACTRHNWRRFEDELTAIRMKAVADNIDMAAINRVMREANATGVMF